MSNDLRRTPPEVIDFIQREFGEIQIDLCASESGHVYSKYLDEDANFLDDDWLNFAENDLEVFKGDLCYINPPYSNPLPFVKQAIKWSLHGYAVADILNHDTSTKWFVELEKHAQLIMPVVGGRIGFLAEDGISAHGNNKPQMMFYLAPFGSKARHTRYVNINEIYLNGKPKK